MLKRLSGAIVMSLALMLGGGALTGNAAAQAANKMNPWPAKAEMDTIMGDYDGTFTPAGGQAAKAYARAIAYPDGRYQVVLYTQEWPKESEKTRFEVPGQLKGDTVEFAGQANDPKGQPFGPQWQGSIKGGQLTATGTGEGGGEFKLAHLYRKSASLGMKPLPGATVLLPYDGKSPSSLAAFDNNPTWKLLPEGIVEVTHGDLFSKQKFGDAQVHLEFCLPFMPSETGQGRANSGVYLQNRYEVQVLDSFGLVERDDDCAGVYHYGAPKMNACLPPTCWQTYDIIYRSARFDADCDTSEMPLITVYLNGALVQEGMIAPSPTPGGAAGNTKRGEFRLQDHLNPVHYRNAWILERKDLAYTPGQPAKLIAAPAAAK